METFKTVARRNEGCQLREILLVLFSLLLICVTIGLSVMYARQEFLANNQDATNTSVRPDQPEYCTDAHCLFPAAIISATMNRSAEPCDNFYQHVCGNWANVYGRSIYDQIDYLSRQNQEKVETMIKSYRPRTWVWEYQDKVAYYFQSCVDSFGRQTSGVTDLITHMINKMGGWYPITGDNGNFDLRSAMNAAFGDYGVDVIFGWVIGADPTDNTLNILKVSPLGGLWNMNLWYNYVRDFSKARYLPAYSDFIRNVAFLVRKDLPDLMTEQTLANFEQYVNITIDDIIEVETQIATIYEQSYYLKYYPEDRVEIKRTVSYLSNAEVAPTFYWVDIFQSSLPTLDPPASDATPIALQNRMIGYLKELNAYFAQLLRQDSGSRKITNYLVWRVLMTWMDRLPADFFHEFLTFLQKTAPYLMRRYGTTEDICLGLTQKYLQSGIEGMYINEYLPDYNGSEVHQLYTELKNQMIKEVEKIPWMDKDTRTVATKKVNSIVDRVAYPQGRINDAALNNYYSSLQFANTRGSFINNTLMAFRFHHSRLARHLNEERTDQEWPVPVWHPAAYYSYDFNEVLLPAGSLQLPYYVRGVPEYLNFGGLGTRAMHEIWHSIDSTGAKYDENGNEIDWWSKQTEQEYGKRVDCLVDYLNYTFVEPSGSFLWKYMFNIYSRNYAEDTIDDYASVHLAHRAWKSWEKSERDKKPLFGIADTPDQLFFIQYVQTQCTSFSSIRGKLPTEWKVNSILGTMHSFRTAFSCSADSPMVSEFVCDDIL